MTAALPYVKNREVARWRDAAGRTYSLRLHTDDQALHLWANAPDWSGPIDVGTFAARSAAEALVERRGGFFRAYSSHVGPWWQDRKGGRPKVLEVAEEIEVVLDPGEREGQYHTDPVEREKRIACYRILAENCLPLSWPPPAWVLTLVAGLMEPKNETS